MKELRLLIGILLPPIIGTILFCAHVAIFSEMTFADECIATGLFSLLLVAYLFMAIPSIICSSVMEVLVTKWKESKIIYYGVASGLGLTVSLLFFVNRNDSEWFIPFAVIGALTGFLTALPLRQLHMREKSLTNETSS